MIRQRNVIVALLPLAWIYGFIQGIRNLLFNSSLLKSQKAPIKTLIIGNLTVGGTGKTPHVIWLAGELSKTKNIAILSRGYGRNSKGFHWVNENDDPGQCGDEPLEMKKLLPNVPVAVDGNRLRALKRMHAELDPVPDIVILDDGFQHRRLIPDYSIILSNMNRPVYEDYLLPAGRLREPLSSIRRADSVIISNMRSEDQTKNGEFRKLLKLKSAQHLFTSSFEYSKLQPLGDNEGQKQPSQVDGILLVTGIADNSDLVKQAKSIAPTYILDYPDHYNYSQKDILRILAVFLLIEGENKILITTDKDSVKLLLYDAIRELPVYSLKREIHMVDDQKNKLIESIINHG